MASHESYYSAGYSAPSAGPPPPPPKSQDPSRTSTPVGPPLPPHPNAAQFQQGRNQYSPAPEPAPPPPPPVPQTPGSPAYRPHSQGPPDHGQGQYQYQNGSQQYPPQQKQTQSHSQIQPQQQQNQHQYSQQSSSGFQQQTTATTAPPIDSGWLSEGLKDHSTADLQPLLNDPDKLDAFAKQHPAYKAALEPIQAAVAANLALAQHVAQLESQVQQLRDQTGQLLLNHTSLQTQWRRKQSEMDDALSPWGPRAMYSRLVSSINEQEALLRAVHESFVEGSGESHEFYGSNSGKATEKEVTEWIKRIREGTTTLERRREMRQRWDEGRVGGWR